MRSKQEGNPGEGLLEAREGRTIKQGPESSEVGVTVTLRIAVLGVGGPQGV